MRELLGRIWPRPKRSLARRAASAGVKQIGNAPGAGLLDLPADEAVIESLFQAILERSVGNDSFKAEHANRMNVETWIRQLVSSPEFTHMLLRRHGELTRSPAFLKDADYRNPSLDRMVFPEAVLVVGSCMTVPWVDCLRAVYPQVHVRHQLFYNASALEDMGDEELARYAFQVVQIPLRATFPDSWALGRGNAAGLSPEQIFEDCLVRLQRNLHAAVRYHRQTGLPTFVLNFAVPQRNPLGMLQPKYGLSNPCYLISELNRHLYEMIEAEKGVYLIDYDEITANLGKRYMVDDVTLHVNHGSFAANAFQIDDLELTAFGDVDAILAPSMVPAILATFNECVSAYNILLPTQKTKIVIFDLDGTLWHGIAAERDDPGLELGEGWPLGILEAAAFLRMRGILIAIVSKNDPTLVEAIWERVYGDRFPLANFVSRKISWGSKAAAIGEILSETNLLPGNCLFVDDNPIEREQAKLAFPELRVIEGPICLWRRELLWSVEMQVPTITRESAERTASIQTVIKRETVRREMSEDDYIASLGIALSIDTIRSAGHPRFSRALELLNKTNQFNTTGQRWSEREIAAFLDDGGEILTGEVADRLTDYGLTAVVLAQGSACVQFVMSCRTFGLRVEFALFDRFLTAAAGREGSVLFTRTAKNGPARGFLDKLGLGVAAAAHEGDAVTLAVAPGFVVPDALKAGVAITADLVSAAG